MAGNLSVENVQYHRGADGNLYYSAALLLNGQRIAFYNSEYIELIVYEGVQNKIHEILDVNFKKYNIPGKSEKEKLYSLMEKLREGS